MKKLFIEARLKPEIFQEVKGIEQLPEKIGLFYSIQYRDFFKGIKEQLERKGKKVFSSKTLAYEGQILGCNISAALSIQHKVDCFLLIGSGRWHALNLALGTERPIYIIKNGRIEMLDHKEIDAVKRKRKAALSKFLFSEKIGVIVSTKPGQMNLEKAISIKRKLEKSGKKAFIFISDYINTCEFENFKIDFWINTACAGMIFDFQNMLNVLEYESLEKQNI